MRTDGRIIEFFKNEIETEEFEGYDGRKLKIYFITVNDKRIDLSDEILGLLSSKYYIIFIKNEMFTVYWDFENSILYIDPIIEDGYPQYDGISNTTIKQLTEFVGWKHYKILTSYYDYEESCLCIRRCNSNIKPQDLTEWERDCLSEKLIDHILHSQKLTAELYDGMDLQIKLECDKVRDNLELQIELLKERISDLEDEIQQPTADKLQQDLS